MCAVIADIARKYGKIYSLHRYMYLWKTSQSFQEKVYTFPLQNIHTEASWSCCYNEIESKPKIYLFPTDADGFNLKDCLR